MYTNWRWKFLSQNNPVLIRSMRRFNIWVKKGFFNHFPNSKQLFPCSLVYMWFALICSFTLSLSVHVISCIQLLVDDVISLQRSLKLSIYFFPVWSHVSAVKLCASNSRTIYAHTLPPKILEIILSTSHIPLQTRRKRVLMKSKES